MKKILQNKYLKQFTMLEILIDDREIELIKTFNLLELSTPIKIQRLEIGDLVCGNAVIERKEGNDFVMSLMDGRLVEQINNMQTNFSKCCIVIYGDILGSQSEIRHKSIIGMIASICTRTNVNIVMFSDIQSLTYFCYQFLIKANDNKLFKQTQLKKSNLPLNVKILTQIDGIGYKQALNLISKFGSVKDVLLANSEQLRQLDGIGKKTAEKIRVFSKLFY